MNEPQNQLKNALIPGLAIIGCFVTGIAAFIWTFFLDKGISVPFCLFVSSMSFGIIAWIAYR